MKLFQRLAILLLLLLTTSACHAQGPCTGTPANATCTPLGLYAPTLNSEEWYSQITANWNFIDGVFAGTTHVPGITNNNGIGSGVYTGQTNVYSFGKKQTFSSDATTAGTNFRTSAIGDPSTLVSGDFWIGANPFTGRAALKLYSTQTDILATIFDFSRPPKIGDLVPNAAYFTSADSTGTNAFEINNDAGSGTGGLKIGPGGPSIGDKHFWSAFSSGMNLGTAGINFTNSPAISQSYCTFNGNTICGIAVGGNGTNDAYGHITSTVTLEEYEFTGQAIPGTGALTITGTDGLSHAILSFGNVSGAYQDVALFPPGPSGNTYLNVGQARYSGQKVYFCEGWVGMPSLCPGAVDDHGNASFASVAVTQSTPASSSTTCTAGQIWGDANYIYICDSTNHAKRTAVSSF